MGRQRRHYGVADEIMSACLKLVGMANLLLFRYITLNNADFYSFLVLQMLFKYVSKIITRPDSHNGQGIIWATTSDI